MKEPKRAAADPPPLRGWTSGQVALLFAALLFATLAAYQPAWHGGLVWDDDAHVTAAALRSWDGLRRIWLELGATQQYYPLTHSAFWLMQRLWGDWTTGYHLVNILLHALSACLFAVVLRRLAVPGAVLAAVFFALHPVHVESVAWITELKNTLSGVFYLAATLAYLGFEQRRSPRGYALAAALFGMALLSKTVTATWPAAMLIVAWWRRGRIDWRRDGLPLLPFVAAGAAAGLTTAWVERVLIGARGAEFQLTLVERALVAGRALWFYPGKLLWPANLAFVYPRWVVSQSAWWQYLFPAGAVAALAACWALRARSRAPLAAALLFVVTLAPALGFVNVYPFRFSFVADHFQYLASLPVIALASAALASAARAKVAWRRARPGTLLSAGALLAVAAPLGARSWHESRQYADAETLYRETIARNPGAWMAHHNLAALKVRGSGADLDLAIAHATEAVRLNPAEADARNTLAVALQRQGRLEEAAAQYEEAIRLRPDRASAPNNLGTVRRAQGRLDEAVHLHRQAVRLEPRFGEAHRNLGLALQELGRLEEAVAHLEEAVRLEPGSAVARDALGTARLRQGRAGDAAAEYRAAIAADPGFAEAHHNLGFALESLGRTDEAESAYRDALRLRPEASLTRENLGRLLYSRAHQLHMQNRLEESVPRYREALALVFGPLAAQVHNDLGAALARLGRSGEAREQFEAALAIRPDLAEARANLARAVAGSGGR